MLKISNQVINYKQLVTGNYQIENDLYGIASYLLTPSRIAAVKNCSFNISDNACVYFFCKCGWYCSSLCSAVWDAVLC